MLAYLLKHKDKNEKDCEEVLNAVGRVAKGFVRMREEAQAERATVLELMGENRFTSTACTILLNAAFLKE